MSNVIYTATAITVAILVRADHGHQDAAEPHIQHLAEKLASVDYYASTDRYLSAALK